MIAGGTMVCIVDDDPSLRDALASLLRSVGHTVAPFASTEDFLAAPWRDAAGCLVLDVRLPGTSGLELQRRLRERGPDLPVVFITGHGDIPMSVAAMKQGAIEFLTKPFRDQDLIDAVNRGIALDRERRARLATSADLRARYDALTPREREVMGLVAQGRMNKEIAFALGLSEITVKVHRGHMMRKMKARSLPDLVRMADHIDPPA
ncbi:response regulator transcription factor [Acuticoccus sp. I52.16.1]|uniref:response regulator transcription factor n=1 Tax=Acuticoccus sp. I52.16.1 TaxID=2928472 RepID=UPI001FD2801F|nr:response regulator transcription factor [Acuticoccus sp. I52.16.1]UOM35037.1 response regulator transcription factor [Acuticoccus sp. I52.16.1]